MTIQTQQVLIELLAQTLEDPLIDWGAENLIVISVWLLVISLSLTVGLFSRRLEHALIAAFVTSLITIAFFVIR